MKAVPTTWDEVRFIDGYPGRYVIMARRCGSQWYVAGINADEQPVKTKIDLGMMGKGSLLTVYSDDAKLNGSKTTAKMKKGGLAVTIPQNGAVVVVGNASE